ncbi:26S proteasome regulatory subunit rpn8 [Histoplasma mississippiense (nom. inval.)]|uniref:26S proteasome regulatory subunit rpn8 n=1 Tax=Ajellomyces capsulatus (strain NAm1 / WU24) TaxID=2059318 RepID=UPI000157D5F1|nr:26S proteasome regulatory subunit rpn8 [Histoplasma mississippiense (nom. inval.)]EDN05486.1 26S proteasome regulatory subunit rpn8 [Histoplasma mississippiense (nom. inval.)]
MPATTADTLSMVTRTVSVAPLVLLSVADHYGRSAKGTRRRVVGVLLGQNDGRNVRVSNSFAVPFEEDDKDPSVWFLDHNFVESMNDMFKKINAREKLIGWYHSGPKLRAADLEINELFKRYTPNPLLVIIDVQPKEVGVPTDAYFAVEEIKDSHSLRDIGQYLQKVLDGDLPVKHAILGNLQDVFNLLPNLSTPKTNNSQVNGMEPSQIENTELARAMSIKTNDQLMAIYLSSLIRAITAFHDLIENKIQNRQQQEEQEAKKEDEKNGTTLNGNGNNNNNSQNFKAPANNNDSKQEQEDTKEKGKKG